jgi:adenosylcobinamide-GDP ribazoletransferase
MINIQTETNSFAAAMGFLTRLGPARLFTTEEMASAVRHFTLAGLIVGAIATLPLHLLFGQANAAVQGWLWVALSIWLTRALHWDGWADLWDAWGSCAQGDRFWAIMKDSHIGAFGVIGLVMGLGGQILFAGQLLGSSLWMALLWAPGFGRAAAALIAMLGTPPPTSTLGRLSLIGATGSVVTFQTALALLAGLLLCGAKPVVLACIIATAGLTALLRLSRRQNGLNGDFLGAAIIWGELSAMLGALLSLA